MKSYDIEENDYKVYEALQLSYLLSDYIENISTCNVKRKSDQDIAVLVYELDRVIEPIHILNNIIVDKLSEHQKESESIVNSILHSTNEITHYD